MISDSVMIVFVMSACQIVTGWDLFDTMRRSCLHKPIFWQPDSELSSPGFLLSVKTNRQPAGETVDSNSVRSNQFLCLGQS